ncbi:uncharacterized protein [Euphorbia lathyris]|uniref:uncharacterized protein isoform X2 n=1 Tax=Euphorbia lathyris TaxID=212925 RepID=UPI0033135954
MEEQISIFSKSLTSFSNHLQSSCDALKLSLDRRPIPLDSASSTFIQCLNRRVSTAGTDLSLLESMSFGTVSFEELLGHCNEVYKTNETDLLQLADRLNSFGYVSGLEIDGDDDPSILTPLGLEKKDDLDLPSYCYPLSGTSSIMRSLEEDSLMDESMNLKNLGLSDVCLASLASEANSNIDDTYTFMREPMKHYDGKLQSASSLDQTAELTFEGIGGEVEGALKPVDVVKSVIEVSKDGYESLPSYMKNLTSWEDLLAAVEKINSSLTKKKNTNGFNYFCQDEISSLGLGIMAQCLFVHKSHNESS